MKKRIILLCLIIVSNCYSQVTKRNKNTKKDTMEYFNIDTYKDWEIDTDYSSTERRKFLKNGDNRIRISFKESTIQLEETSTHSSYGRTKVYYATSKSLKSILYEFYAIHIGLYKIYDESGKLIKEIDYDAPYKFSLKGVIAKVKKEYEIDLEDRAQESVLERFESDELNKKPFYEVFLKAKEKKSVWNYILLDGATGEELFKTSRHFPPDNEVITPEPFDQYLEGLKKTAEEDNAYYKTYEGKEYTKKEWEAFEEEWHKNYKEKKNSKGFGDDIFNK